MGWTKKNCQRYWELSDIYYLWLPIPHSNGSVEVNCKTIYDTSQLKTCRTIEKTIDCILSMSIIVNTQSLYTPNYLLVSHRSAACNFELARSITQNLHHVLSERNVRNNKENIYGIYSHLLVYSYKPSMRLIWFECVLYNCKYATQRFNLVALSSRRPVRHIFDVDYFMMFAYCPIAS